jgi:dCMP deaminase
MENQSSNTTKWDERFMRLALEARSWTKGLGNGIIDRGVGACVVSPDKSQFSLGFAGFPKGIADTPERMASPEFRFYHTAHAELNAILNARTLLVGWTLYSTECPCAECSNAIIQAGIARVVSTPPRRASNWHRSQLEGADSLREVGIIVDRMEHML